MTPDGWTVATVGDLVELINGRGFTPAEWGHSGLPIIRIQNLNGGIEFNYTEAPYDERILVRRGDLLFSWSGNRGTSFGPHLWHGPDGLLNQHIFRVIPKHGVDLMFLHSAMRQITESIEQQAHGGSGLVHIKKSELVKFVLSIPSLPEQKKIAAILGSVDEAIQATQAVIDQTRKVKQGLLQELLTRGIGHTRFKKTEIGEIPEEWTVVSFGDICSTIVDGVHKKPNYVSHGIPFVTVKNLTAGEGISFDDLNYITREDHTEFIKRTHPAKGDVLLSKDGTLGVPRVVETDREFSVFVSVALMKPIKSKVCPYFMREALESPIVASQFGINQAGSALQHIHLVDLRRTRCPLPSMVEQKQITAMLDASTCSIREQQAHLVGLLRLRAGLMQDLLTGRVRVKGVA